MISISMWDFFFYLIFTNDLNLNVLLDFYFYFVFTNDLNLNVRLLPLLGLD